MMSAFSQVCDKLHSALAVFCQQHGCDFSDDMEMAFDADGELRTKVFLLKKENRTFVVYPCLPGIYGFADGGFLWAQDDDNGDYFWTIPNIEKDRVLPDDWEKIVGLAENYFLKQGK